MQLLIAALAALSVMTVIATPNQPTLEQEEGLPDSAPRDTSREPAVPVALKLIGTPDYSGCSQGYGGGQAISYYCVPNFDRNCARCVSGFEFGTVTYTARTTAISKMKTCLARHCNMKEDRCRCTKYSSQVVNRHCLEWAGQVVMFVETWPCQSARDRNIGQ